MPLSVTIVWSRQDYNRVYGYTLSFTIVLETSKEMRSRSQEVWLGSFKLLFHTGLWSLEDLKGKLKSYAKYFEKK